LAGEQEIKRQKLAYTKLRAHLMGILYAAVAAFFLRAKD